MSDIIPDDVSERDLHRRRLGVPTWALTLCIAIIATCVAVFAAVQVVETSGKVDSTVGTVSSIENAYRHDVYNNCLQSQRNRTQFIDALTSLRDADRKILHAAHGDSHPVTAFGIVDLVGIRTRVNAYDELLHSSFVKKLDCATLAPSPTTAP